MPNSPLRSNGNRTYFLKYGTLILAILSFVFALIRFLGRTPEESSFELLSDFRLDTLIFLAFSVFFLTVWLYLKDRIILVTILNNGLRLDDGRELETVEWSKIKSINQLPIGAPPLYRLRLTDRENSFLFVTGRYFLTIGFFSWDLSEMGKAIKRKKKQGHI